MIAQIEEVAKQAAEGEEPGSPWDQLATYLRAVAALLRGEAGMEVPAAFAEHYAAIEKAAKGEDGKVSPGGAEA